MNALQKHNSFSRPPVFTQIIAYTIVLSSFLIYTASIQPHFINVSLRIALNVLYYSSFTAVLVTGILTSCSDPSDRMLRKEKELLQKENLTNAFYCQICRGVVAAKTRHCRICNICVAGFDHHCIWINNCIGQQNYKIFIAMLLLVNANFVVFEVSLLLLWLESQWVDYLPSMIANWTFAVILLVFLLLILALTLFHFFLIYKDRTTYEHIVMGKKAIIAPDHSQKEQEGQRQPSREDNSVTKLANFKTETQLASVPNGSEEEDSRKVRDIMIFQAESRQQNSQTESKSQEKSSQARSIEGVKVLSLKSRDEHKSSRSFEADSRIFNRNKSLNYIFGQINSVQPCTINYRSEFMRHEKGKTYILEYKHNKK